MIIRRLMREDAANWRDFRLKMLRETPRAFGTTHAEASARPLASFADWLAQIHLFAALDSERIVGAAGWYVLEGETTSHRGRIISVFVDRTHRGTGLIDSLLKEIFADVTGQVLQLELGVSGDNSTALRAYQRNGFEVIGKTPRAVCHAGVFTDDFQMLKRLDA